MHFKACLIWTQRFCAQMLTEPAVLLALCGVGECGKLTKKSPASVLGAGFFCANCKKIEKNRGKNPEKTENIR